MKLESEYFRFVLRWLKIW